MTPLKTVENTTENRDTLNYSKGDNGSLAAGINVKGEEQKASSKPMTPMDNQVKDIVSMDMEGDGNDQSNN